MTTTQSILDAFAAIGVPEHELKLLAISVDWGSDTIPDDEVVLLRDAWTRCNNGELRPEAFWAWVSDKPSTDDDLF